MENPWTQGATHTHTTRRSRRKSKAVEKRTFFSKTACTLVVPFLGVQVDQCFCRGGGIVGWKGVCINGVESGSKAGKSQALATGAGVVPDFPGLCALPFTTGHFATRRRRKKPARSTGLDA